MSLNDIEPEEIIDLNDNKKEDDENNDDKNVDQDLKKYKKNFILFWICFYFWMMDKRVIKFFVCKLKNKMKKLKKKN